MTTFQTPNPISVDIDLGWGDVHVVATDRADTVAEVRPADPEKSSDVKTAADFGVDASPRGSSHTDAEPFLLVNGTRGSAKS